MPQMNRGQVDAFFASLSQEELLESRYGIERETLRVDAQGRLALTPHPPALGSALTHPSITTDFSEALLEFVTETADAPWQVIQSLCEMHQFTAGVLDGEQLWPLSMPGLLPDPSEIPLARYGSSNVGQMKTVYRRGLGHRYGRAMQTIAGVHFNFSPSDGFWRNLSALRGDRREEGIARSAAYFVLVRNFRRYAWLVLYLFGASPAVCRSFLDGRDHGLQLFDSDTLYLPNATSLRMSDLGYNSSAQSSLNISLNSLEEYAAGLARAIETPYPEYAAIGVRDGDNWRQLSASILQIANEFYSVVRPKRVAKSGEKPASALRQRGVEYVEIRALDVSPFDPVGISQAQVRFLECFLLLCAVSNCDVISPAEQVEMDTNQLNVARQGRLPRLPMQRLGEATTLRDWARDLFDSLDVIAGHLDLAGDRGYAASVEHYRRSIEDASLTPSARVLEAMRGSGNSHTEYGLTLAAQHARYFASLAEMCESRLARFESQAHESHSQQARVEREDNVDFETYLARYYAQP